MIGTSRTGYGKTIQRKRMVRVAAFAAVAVAVGVGAFIPLRTGIIHFVRRDNPDQALAKWEQKDWKGCYDDAGDVLASRPLDPYWLTLRGFSAYQLASDQVASDQASALLEDSVFSLRKALIVGSGKMEARIRYVLGKAYFQRGRYYADSAIQELSKARDLGFEASDLDEHLGLAAAELGEYRDSIVYLSRSLTSSPSDLLLLAIARSYSELDEYGSAEAYYRRCIEATKDFDIEVGARISLSATLRALNRLDDAEAVLKPVLDANAENVDALFEMGELFAKKGDAVRARAEWRKIVRIDPANSRARARLSM